MGPTFSYREFTLAGECMLSFNVTYISKHYIQETTGITVEGNFFPPGEGKNDLDRVFGRVRRLIKKFLREQGDLNGKLETLLKTLWDLPNSKLYWIIPDRATQQKIEVTLPNNSEIRQYPFADNEVMGRLASGHGEAKAYPWGLAYQSRDQGDEKDGMLCIHCGELREGKKIHRSCVQEAVC
jgi:hypothetical protein